MKKKLLAMFASAALALAMSSVAFANEPVIAKQVKDLNGTEAIESDWQDAADCAVSAQVPFRLSAQLPDDFDSYTTYELVFHDTMAKSLTFNESSVSVYCEDAAGTRVDLFGTSAITPVEGISVATVDIPKGETFNLAIQDARAISEATAGSTIFVEYTAMLTDKAVTGAIETGNPNRFYVTYPESPNSGEIVQSVSAMATVFTYKVTLECRDGQDQPLAGSEFKIYRNESGDYQELTAAQFTSDASGSIFTARGIDQGQYKVSEVVAPEGCAPMDDIYFTVIGTYETGSHGVQLTKYEYQLTDEAGNPIEEAGQSVFFVDKDKGNLSRTVIHTDAQSTGDEAFGSRIIFVIAGAIILVGAVITIVAVRKKPQAR